jgi:hypothetical protein
MTTVLKQRYFLSTKAYELRPDKIVVIEKSLFDDKEWEARYDQIGLDVEKIKSREGIGNAILFGGLLIVTSIMTFDAFTELKTDLKLAFLFLFFCFMWGTVFWWSIQKYFAAHFVLIGGNKVLTFFINSPDEKTVREFIEKIREKTKEKLKTDLTTFDPDLTFSNQLEHIKYLKRIDVLT